LWRLDEFGAYIEKDDPDAAARVIARLVASIDMLAELPASGRIGRIAGTREIVLSDIHTSSRIGFARTSTSFP
jgi:plasmid stabilization system protein ParE